MLYKKVRPLIVSDPRNMSKIEEWGLFFRPIDVKVPEYKTDYKILKSQLDLVE